MSDGIGRGNAPPVPNRPDWMFDERDRGYPPQGFGGPMPPQGRGYPPQGFGGPMPIRMPHVVSRDALAAHRHLRNQVNLDPNSTRTGATASASNFQDVFARKDTSNHEKKMAVDDLVRRLPNTAENQNARARLFEAIDHEDNQEGWGIKSSKYGKPKL